MSINIDHRSSDYFPSIDFNFRNNGTATAILNEFRLKVISFEIDKTPALEFEYSVENGSDYRNNPGTLVIYSVNYGYGQFEGELSLSHPELKKVFPIESLVFKGTIGADQKLEILRLDPSLIDQPSLSKLLKDKESESQGKKEFIEITNLYLDDKPVVGINSFSSLSLSRDGFVNNIAHVAYSLSMSDATYCTMVDIDAVNMDKSYKISRKIPPGDIDRFHIQIGANKSSILKIKFQFVIDGKKLVESELFEIHIWNPSNGATAANYQDGAILTEDKINEHTFFVISGEKRSSRFGKWF